MDLRLLSSGPVASFHPSPHHHPHHQHPFHHQSLDNHLYSDPGLFPGYSYDHHHHPMNHGNIYNGTVNWTPQASSCDVNSHYIPSETPPTPVTTITASATYCVPCSPRSSSSTNPTTESPGLYHNSELIKSGPNCDYYNPSPSSTGSTNFLTPSPPSYSNGLVVNTANPPTTPTSATPCLTENETDLAVVGLRQPKKRNTANKKERKRTVSINTAFSLLRDHIPNVPTDTKLSKIKTLRLATNYISYLMKLLDQSNSPNMSAAGGKVPLTCEDFKVDLQRFKGIKSENDLTSLKMTSTVKDRCSISEGSKRGKGRTGWPQHVWALELKREHTET